MSEVVKRLRDRRLAAWNEARALADTAAEASRSFTGEEQQKWDTLNSEIDSLDQRAKALIEGEQRAKDTEEAFQRLEGRTPERRHESDSQAELRAFIVGESGQRGYDVLPQGPVNLRDLSKGTATAGGNTVASSFYNRLMERLVESAAILQTNPTLITTEGGEPIDVPKVTDYGSAAIVPEATVIPESDPAFGKVTLGAYKYGHLAQISYELAKDTGFDLEGFLARIMGRNVGNALGAHLLTGDGTNKPRGVLADTTLGATASGPTGFGSQATANQGFDTLITLFHSVIAPYRASSSAAWVMNDTTAALVRKIKNADGVYAWQASVVAGEPDTILGKRVVIDPGMPNPTAALKPIIFGDFAAYAVRLAGGFRFERSDHFAFDKDQITFRALVRGDGATIDTTGALKHLVMAP